jgi:histidinol dehydrogenase
MPNEVVDQKSSAGDSHSFPRKSYQVGCFKMMGKESTGYEIETAVAEGKRESITDYASCIARQMGRHAIQIRHFEMDALPGKTRGSGRRNIARAGCYVENAKASAPRSM